ncbi:MAG: biotin/lipoyl-containing protein [Terracidiphilus sp.]
MKLKISMDGKSYEAEVEVLEDDAIPHQPNYGPYMAMPTTIQSAPVASAPAPAPAKAAEEFADEGKVCRSPVTGVVIKVNIEPGQTIQSDDLLMVLEAMKMETNVTACGSGKVKNVRVAQGDSVKVNQVVVEFE